MVIPIIINITMEIDFSSKVYSKSLLKGSPLSCTSLEEVISCPEVWRLIFCKSKENQYLVQKYGGRYFAKVKRIDILSRSMEANMFDKRIGACGYIL